MIGSLLGGRGRPGSEGKDDVSSLFHFYFELMNLDDDNVCVRVFYLFALSVLLQSYFQTACAVSSVSSVYFLYSCNAI